LDGYLQRYLSRNPR